MTDVEKKINEKSKNIEKYTLPKVKPNIKVTKSISDINVLDEIDKLCGCNFDSNYANVTDSNGKVLLKSISIDNFLDNLELQTEVISGEKKLVCDNGYTLIKYESKKIKSHFKHKNNLSDNTMSKWHIDWQKKFNKNEIHIGGRIADVVIDKTVLEFQHSPITNDVVRERTNNYTKHGYKCFWIIDCNDSITIKNIDNLLHVIFTKGNWKHESFKNNNYVYLNKDNLIYRIDPTKVKMNIVKITGRDIFEIDDFLDNIDCELLEDSSIRVCTKNDNRNISDEIIYFNQRGAGCGKTYESVQLVENDVRFKHKETFIYLTKMHSAKEVILNEFKNQALRCNLEYLNQESTPDSFETVGKQYRIKYKNKNYDKTTTIIIGTIDSFMYAVGDKNANGSDYFQAIIKSIREGSVNTSKAGAISYAKSSTKLNKQCLIIIDEAQDLGPEYICAFDEIIKKTGIDMYVIGDKLQSIWGEHNIHTYLDTNKTYTNIERSDGKNQVMRFHNVHFKDFVNKIIDFKKYGLPPIEDVCNVKNCRYKHEEMIPYKIFQIHDVYKDINNINRTIEQIIFHMDDEIKRNKYLPNNFMFIFPVLKNNIIANRLEAKLQEYWIDKFSDATYRVNVISKDPYWKSVNSNKYHKYVFFHKSEEGQPINLKESENATRILSIHASKGNGCEVVFVLGITEKSLQMFGKKNTIVYDSLLHVAITRQKKSLYFGIVNKNDDIFVRFKKSGIDIQIDKSIAPEINMKKTNESSAIINQIISNEELFNLINTNIIIPNNTYKEILPKENKQKNTIIDWGHHIMRYSVLMYNIMSNIIEKEIIDNENSVYDQFVTILKRLSKMNIERYLYKEYYTELKKISENNKNSKYENNVVIPILFFKTNEKPKHHKYSLIITEFMKHIQKKILSSLIKNKLPCLCPLESTIFMHMKDVINDGIYSKISIMDIYTLMYCYDECSNSIDDYHTIQNECICKKNFSEGDNSTDTDAYLEIRTSICNHYDKLDMIRKLYESYKKNMCGMGINNLKYNISHPVCFFENSDDFDIFGKYPIIAYNEKYVVYFFVRPQVNKLNINRVYFDIIFNDYFLKNCRSTQEKNYNRYNNKKIIACIFSFDLDEPIIFEANIDKNDDTIKSCLKKAILANYSDHHERIFDLYNYCKAKRPENTDSISHMCSILKGTIYSKVPRYVLDFFANIHNELSDLKSIKNSDSDRKTERERVLSKVTNKDFFLEKIGDSLESATNKYFSNSFVDYDY
jgi:hypothetical protein